jgi:hypothetical protein
MELSSYQEEHQPGIKRKTWWDTLPICKHHKTTSNASATLDKNIISWFNRMVYFRQSPRKSGTLINFFKGK